MNGNNKKKRSFWCSAIAYEDLVIAELLGMKMSVVKVITNSLKLTNEINQGYSF
jgi:hypothetical protein